MKALFITTRTGDCGNHVRAWESFAGPAEVVFHTPNGIPNDREMLRRAWIDRPDVIFYIGAPWGSGCPEVETFRRLRHMAPLVNICSDAVDTGWHDTLRKFRAADCFDLHAAIDGADGDLIDLPTVTPIDPRIFAGPPVERDIRCGFSGGYGSRFSFDYKNHDSAYRAKVIYRLEKYRKIVVRRREPSASYADHVAFMKRCRIVLNVSLCGSAEAHQIKGRVIEAGWAGCALLESEGSPAIERFPKGAVLIYRSSREALDLVSSISDAAIALSAEILSRHIRAHCRPEQIYGAMLERVGLRVGLTQPLSAT